MAAILLGLCALSASCVTWVDIWQISERLGMATERLVGLEQMF
jgi:hypothetical protein